MGDIPDPNYHEPSSPYAEPLGAEGGDRLVAEAPVGPGNSRTRLVRFGAVDGSWDARRQAGIRPAFNSDEAWAQAEERARASDPSQANRTWMDPLFAAVFGRRGGR